MRNASEDRSRFEEVLGRDAPTLETGATEATGIDEHHGRSGVGCGERGAVTGSASTDDDEVRLGGGVRCGHRLILPGGH